MGLHRSETMLAKTKTKQVAKNMVQSLWNTCNIVLKKKGHASGK